MGKFDELLEIKEEKIPHRRSALDWRSSVCGRPSFGGIYAFWWRGSVEEFLSSIQNPELHFNGPGGKQLTLRIDESCLHITENGRLPLYIGKNATDIAKRIGLHLKLGTDRTVRADAVNGIAKRMTTSCQVRDRIDRLFPNFEDTRPVALNNLSLSYTRIHGEENFVERFYLEGVEPAQTDQAENLNRYLVSSLSLTFKSN